jgi:hypothetical protein
MPFNVFGNVFDYTTGSSVFGNVFGESGSVVILVSQELLELNGCGSFINVLNGCSAEFVYLIGTGSQSIILKGL